MKLPTAEQITPHDDLDGRIACKHFLDKSLEEAEALFQENSCRYQEDLMWMGPVAFRFYLKAALHYIKSEAATGDSGMIDSFAGLLEFRWQRESTELAPIAPQLVEICGYIIDHYEKFDLAPGIYGDMRARFQELQQVFLK